MRLADLIFWDF